MVELNVSYAIFISLTSFTKEPNNILCNSEKKTEKYNKHISLPSTMLGELSPFEVAAGQVNLVIFPSPFIHV